MYPFHGSKVFLLVKFQAVCFRHIFPVLKGLRMLTGKAVGGSEDGGGEVVVVSRFSCCWRGCTWALLGACHLFFSSIFGRLLLY